MTTVWTGCLEKFPFHAKSQSWNKYTDQESQMSTGSMTQGREARECSVSLLQSALPEGDISNGSLPLDFSYEKFPL